MGVEARGIPAVMGGNIAELPWDGSANGGITVSAMLS